MQRTKDNPHKGVYSWFVGHMETIAVVLLTLLCLLPAIMSLCFPAMYLAGMFPTDELLAAYGTRVGYINYNNAISVYHGAFLCVGLPTLAFSVVSVLICRGRVLCRDSVYRMPWFYLLLGVMLWSMVSTAQSIDLIRALHGHSYGHDGLYSYFIYGGVFLCASMIQSEKNRLRLLRVFGGVVCYLAILMIVQEATRNPFLDHSFPSFRATVFNQFNHFGYVLCMGLMALTGLYLYDDSRGRGLRALYLAGVALLTYALLLNDTFGCYLATLATVPVVYVFYARSGRKVNGAALLPAILFVVISALNCLGLTFGARPLLANLSQFGVDIAKVATGAEDAGRAGTGRFILWKDTIERIGQRPIFGFGPEGFWGEYAITNNDSTHNEYLRIAGFLGIPALLMYLGALVTLARRQWKELAQLPKLVVAAAGVTVVYLFSAFFGNPLFNTYPYFWLFLGLTTAQANLPPLLAPELADVEEQLRQGVRGKRLLMIAAIALALVVGGLVGFSALSQRTESAVEAADMECMNLANQITRLSLKSGDAKPGGDYWFDASKATLIPASEPAPEPYGMGTSRCGNSAEVVSAENGMDYEYDGSMDYRGSVLRVSIDADDSAAEHVHITWVDGSSRS